MRYIEQPDGSISREYTEDELDEAAHAYKEQARAMLDMNNLMIEALNILDQLGIWGIRFDNKGPLRELMSDAVERAKANGLKLGDTIWPDE